MPCLQSALFNPQLETPLNASDPAVEGGALHQASLVAIADAVAGGRLTAVEVTRHMLERIAARDGTHRAWVRVLDDSALRSAAALDAIARDNGPMGPLHGVPVALKDLIDLAGVPSTVGGIVHGDRIPDHDAHVVRRLKAAGAVILGKVKLTEGAFSGHHPDVEPPLNPWSPEHWTGVSSSGSGVATAARMCFGALGTDTGGSIRFPCAANGLVGIKPSYGRVSRFWAFPLAESMDHVGPMARSVADAARMLTVISGFDEQDPTSLTTTGDDFEAGLGAPVTGLRIGIDRGWIERSAEPSVVAAVEEAAASWSSLGAELVEVELPDAEALISGWVFSCGVEAAIAHGDTFPARRADYGPVLAALLDLGLRTTGIRYAALERAREHYRRGLDRVFGGVDAILTPAMPFPVPSLERMERRPEPGANDAVTFTAPFDYSGHPTVNLPVGLDADGLPRSVQLVGPHLGESILLRLAAALEREWGPLSAPPGL